VESASRRRACSGLDRGGGDETSVQTGLLDQEQMLVRRAGSDGSFWRCASEPTSRSSRGSTEWPWLLVSLWRWPRISAAHESCETLDTTARASTTSPATARGPVGAARHQLRDARVRRHPVRPLARSELLILLRHRSSDHHVLRDLPPDGFQFPEAEKWYPAAPPAAQPQQRPKTQADRWPLLVVELSHTPNGVFAERSTSTTTTASCWAMAGAFEREPALWRSTDLMGPLLT